MPVTAKNTKVEQKPTARYHGSVDLGEKKLLPVEFGGTAFSSVSGKQYFPFLAPDDNLFRTLLEIRLLSPTQSNCIGDKTLYSIGDGLQVQGEEFPKDFDRKINGKRQTIDDVTKAIFESLYQDGNKFIEIVKTQVAGEWFVHAYPHNNLDCRFEVNEDGSDPTHVIRSKEFRRDGIYTFKKEEVLVRIPIWTDDIMSTDDVWAEDPKKAGIFRTMLVIKNEIQGVDHYGLPSNFAGMTQALSEYKAASFNNDNFDNNLFISGLLSIMGQMSSTESKALVRDIRKAHTGKGKQQRVFVTSSESGLNDTKFTPFTEKHDGHFVEFDKHNVSKIISANGWSKDLMDLSQSSGLGKGGEYLSQLFKIKFRTVISPAQQLVLNNFIFPLMKIIDETKGTGFYDMPWIIKPVIPISLEGILDINSLLTVDEGRAEIGKQPLNNETGKKMISEVAAKQNPKNEKEVIQ